MRERSAYNCVVGGLSASAERARLREAPFTGELEPAGASRCEITCCLDGIAGVVALHDALILHPCSACQRTGQETVLPMCSMMRSTPSRGFSDGRSSRVWVLRPQWGLRWEDSVRRWPQRPQPADPPLPPGAGRGAPPGGGASGAGPKPCTALLCANSVSSSGCALGPIRRRVCTRVDHQSCSVS